MTDRQLLERIDERTRDLSVRLAEHLGAHAALDKTSNRSAPWLSLAVACAATVVALVSLILRH